MKEDRYLYQFCSLSRIARQSQKPVYDVFYRAVEINTVNTAAAKKLNKSLLTIQYGEALSVTYTECQNPETTTSPIGAWTEWAYPLINGNVIGLLKINAGTDLTNIELPIRITMMDNLDWILRVKNKYIEEFKESEEGKRLRESHNRGRGRGRGGYHPYRNDYDQQYGTYDQRPNQYQPLGGGNQQQNYQNQGNYSGSGNNNGPMNNNGSMNNNGAMNNHGQNNNNGSMNRPYGAY